jgi:phosphoribosylanthranilate isomerase
MTPGPFVKICGIKRPEDAQLCAELGADLLGFIFHPKSPRCVRPGLPASPVIRDLPGIRTVGVFVEQTVQEILALMEAGRLDLAQLHGDQNRDFCAELAKEIGPERIIKVVWPERADTPQDFQAVLDTFAPCCGHFLADAGTSGGGHGRVIGGDDDPDGAPGALDLAVFPKPLILAGGLGPHNLKEMLARYLPAGVDLNSGVESAPGVKDENPLRAAFEAIRRIRAAAQNNEVLP